MKRQIRIASVSGFMILSLMACKESRYTEKAAEIDTFKRLNKAVLSGDMNTLSAIYADSAKVYYNSTNALTWKQAVEGMAESLDAFSEYEYQEDQEYEFVTTDKGEQWLGWWAVFIGTLKQNGRQVQIPVHVSARFVDGKIVEESGYWDNEIITDALQTPDNPDAELEEEQD